MNETFCSKPRVRARVSLAAAILLVLVLAGCLALPMPTDTARRRADAGPKPKPEQPTSMMESTGRLSTKVLDQICYAYADRYMTLIVSACDAIAKDNPSAEQRRLAHLIKLTGVTSTYDIVTTQDSFTKLLDLVLVVTLQS